MATTYSSLPAIYQGDDWSHTLALTEGVPATVEPEWDEATAYLAAAEVAYDGEVWTALLDNTGQEPTVGGDYWAPNEQALDLFAWTVMMHLRHTPSSSQHVAVTISTPDATGVLVLSLTPEQTGDLDARNYVWDLETVDPDGLVETYLKGTVTVTAEVTR